MKTINIRLELGPKLAEWNPSAPLKSFQQLAGHIHGTAKEVLLRDGMHTEMFFLVPLNGQCQIAQWSGSDRQVQAQWLRKHIHQHYIYGVIHVCECWMRAAAGPNDTTIAMLAAGKLRVSQLPVAERTEALSVTAQSRDGYCHIWTNEMHRDKGNGNLTLGADMGFDDIGGRFGELFK